MSDTKNHKLAIKAIIEAHRTPGKMREIMLTILADKPSAIVNAWEEVKPVMVGRKSRKTGGKEPITCQGCYCIMDASKLAENNNRCLYCGAKLVLSP